MSMSPRPVAVRRHYVALIAIVIIAFGFRMWLLRSYSPAGPWVASLTLTDAEMGRNLLAGRGWVSNQEVIDQATRAQEGQPTMVDLERFLPTDDAKPGVLVTQGTAHSPGYSIWFAISYWLGGHVRYGYSQLMQALLDASACLLVFAIGRRVWSSAAGLAAAALYALSPAHAFLANLTVAASTDSFWFLAVAYGALRGWNAVEEGRRPWAGALIVAAASLCGAAMNSTSLVLPSVVSGVAIVAALFDRRALRLAPYVVSAQLLVALLLTPWALRNEQLFGQFSPVRGGFWQVAYASWGELPNPWGLGFDDKYYWNWIEENCPGCDSGRQAAKTRDFILSGVVKSPGFADHMARLVVSRLPRLLEVAKIPGGVFTDTGSPRATTALRTVLGASGFAVPVAAVLVIVGFGFVLARRESRAAALLAVGPSIFLIVFSLVFFVELRKTVPAYGCLLVFAGVAITELVRRARPALAVLVIAVLVHPPSLQAQVAAGGQMHAAVVKPDGTVWSWGINTFGQLGDGRMGNTILEGVQAIGFGDATAVAAGGNHTLALRKDGTVWAWGDNFWGELGDGTRRTRDVPAPVPGLPPIVAIAAGYLHSMALAADGTVWAWGDNHYGQLGSEAPAWSYRPARVEGLQGIASIHAGFFHSLAIDRSGRVLAWGQNTSGQLGDGTRQSHAAPAAVALITDAATISAGQLHTLLLRRDGTVWSWGGNVFGQLGRVTPTRLDASPGLVLGLADVTAIAAGEDHSLGLTRDRQVWAWGDNLYGQVADGTWDARDRPTKVVGLGPATGIATGHAHALAITEKGTIFTWGFGNEGELGDNVILRRRAVPAAVTAVALVPGPDFDSAAFHPITPAAGTWLAPIVEASGGVFTINGKADTSTGYVIATQATTAGPDEPMKALAARGTVVDGCVTVGVQRDNQWVFYKNYALPGPFTMTWEPPASGAYVIVVAHCLPEGRLKNNFEVSHLGWFSNTTRQ